MGVREESEWIVSMAGMIASESGRGNGGDRYG